MTPRAATPWRAPTGTSARGFAERFRRRSERRTNPTSTGDRRERTAWTSRTLLDLSPICQGGSAAESFRLQHAGPGPPRRAVGLPAVLVGRAPHPGRQARRPPPDRPRAGGPGPSGSARGASCSRPDELILATQAYDHAAPTCSFEIAALSGRPTTRGRHVRGFADRTGGLNRNARRVDSRRMRHSRASEHRYSPPRRHGFPVRPRRTPTLIGTLLRPGRHFRRSRILVRLPTAAAGRDGTRLARFRPDRGGSSARSRPSRRRSRRSAPGRPGWPPRSLRRDGPPAELEEAQQGRCTPRSA